MPSDRHREAARILRIAHRDFKAWIAALEHEYPRSHEQALLCRLVMSAVAFINHDEIEEIG